MGRHPDPLHATGAEPGPVVPIERFVAVTDDAWTYTDDGCSSHHGGGLTATAPCLLATRPDYPGQRIARHGSQVRPTAAAAEHGLNVRSVLVWQWQPHARRVGEAMDRRPRSPSGRARRSLSRRTTRRCCWGGGHDREVRRGQRDDRHPGAGAGRRDDHRAAGRCCITRQWPARSCTPPTAARRTSSPTTACSTGWMSPR